MPCTAAEFEKTLNDYREALGGGYEHQVLIRVPDGHGFDDSTYEKEAEVLADPTAYADPAIVMPMLERFMEACETAGDRTRWYTCPMSRRESCRSLTARSGRS